MSPRKFPTHAGAAVLAAGLLLPALLGAQSSGDQAARAKPAPPLKAVAPRKLPAARSAPTPKSSSSFSRRTRRTSGAAKGKRRLSARQQRARLHLESERIQEIQRALIQAGYLHAEATGRWDEPTRDAMRRYQMEHGFPATGLPEAKSLMKLGLGPHPLPAEVDPSATAEANAGATTKDGPSANPAPPSHSPESGSPPVK